MDSYSLESHQLSFNDNFSKLIVSDAGEVFVKDYSLEEDSTQGVSVKVENGEYKIETVGRPSRWKGSVATNKDPELSFNRTVLGGMVIIDLRDISRVSAEGDWVTVEFDMECNPLVFWTEVGGGRFLKIAFENNACFKEG